MPIYEEKLICPLALRFTQQHIRPIFKDGRELESTIGEITTSPGTGDYDLILNVPFPAIEITRWSQYDSAGVDDDAEHWFTLDNRRLYCLQRIAAEHWPKRCAATVQVLYAARGAVKRKSDSMTAGRCVDIHRSSCVDFWDWQAAVGHGSEIEEASARSLLAIDDSKATVEELKDAPAAPSMLELFLRGGAAALAEPAKAAVEDPSTDLSDSETNSLLDSRSSQQSVAETMARTGTGPRDTLEAMQLMLVEKKHWIDEKGQSYELEQATERSTWLCTRWGVDGARKKFTIWLDEESGYIAWGLDWSYYADASEFLEDPSALRWYSGRYANANKKPRFEWWPSKESTASSSSESFARRPPRQDSRWRRC